MIRTLRRTLAIVALALPSTFAAAAGVPEGTAQLFMFESPGCHYCLQWKEEIGPIYPKTAEGKFAPLQMIDIDDPLPAGITFQSKAVYTPTFVLVQNGQEIGRVEGYPGEDFFWGLLDMMLKAKTSFATGETAESGT
ncbi:thioredoxin family protein [Thalassobius sp. MITS945101]|uniref:thioredoxin family protein n=1 Tax=Thalassobius sp. MITS945101 TaxID=3096994 RepID=UPI00399B7E39